MDAARTQELDRILQNRRSRGALLSSAASFNSSSPAAAPIGGASVPERQSSPRARSIGNAIGTTSLSSIGPAPAAAPLSLDTGAFSTTASYASAAGQQGVIVSGGGPSPTNRTSSASFAVPKISYSNAALGTDSIRQSMSYREYETRRDRHNGDTNGGQAGGAQQPVLLGEQQQQQRQTSFASGGFGFGSSPRLQLSTPAVLSSFSSSPSRRHGPAAAAAAFNSAGALSSARSTHLLGGGAGHVSHPAAGASNAAQVPVPLIFGNFAAESRPRSGGGPFYGAERKPSSPSGFSLRSAQQTTTARRLATGGGHAASDAPPEPPVCARPLSSSPIDIASSITILSTGDWFYKWNRGGTEVQPRFMWLDTTKFVLTWSRQQTQSSAFSSYVRVENCSNVSTSQVVERDELDRPRVFYVLLIETDDRLLKLATEVREKIDVWFEAIGNLIAFCRAGGPLKKLAESSE